MGQEPTLKDAIRILNDAHNIYMPGGEWFETAEVLKALEILRALESKAALESSAPEEAIEELELGIGQLEGAHHEGTCEPIDHFKSALNALKGHRRINLSGSEEASALKETSELFLRIRSRSKFNRDDKGKFASVTISKNDWYLLANALKVVIAGADWTDEEERKGGGGVR